MIEPLAKFIDWHALQLAATLWLRSAGKWNKAEAKLAEAVDFLNGPGLFLLKASLPNSNLNRKFISDFHRRAV